MHKRILLAALLAAAAVVRPAHATLTSTCSSSTQVGNGSTTAFTFPCKFLQNGDISVTVNGVGKTQPGDYTVSGAGNASGTITFGAAPASGAIIVITRTVDLKQSTSLRQNRSLDPATVETTLDKLAMQVQQVDAKAPTGSGGVATQAYVDAAVAATLTGGLVVQPVSWSLTGDGVTTAYSIPNASVNAPDLYIVTIDGVYQKPATDYTVSVASAQITFTAAPALNAVIAVRSFGYARALSVGDSTSVLATGGTVPRMLKDRFGDLKTVKDYGAVGDGVTDDTVAIQAALNASHDVFIPAGTYKINGDSAFTGGGKDCVDGGIAPRSDSRIVLAPDATLKAKANSTGNYCVLRIKGVSNVTVTGGTIDGNKAQGTGPGGSQYGYAIGIVGSTNIVIDSMILKNNWGDGLIIDGSRAPDPVVQSSNILVNNVVSDSNRRQGLSVIHATDVLVQNSVFSNSSGVAPQDGIDIEPGVDGNNTQRITVIGCNTKNNAGHGISVQGTSTGSNVSAINLSGNTTTGNAFSGISIYTVSGGVTISGNTAKSNTLDGIHVELSSAVTVTGNHANTNTADGLVVAGLSSNVNLSGNEARGNTRGINIYDAAAARPSDILVVGNKVRENNQHGIFLNNTDDTSLVGNKATGDGQSANNTYHEIQVWNSNRILVDANQMRRGSLTNKPGFGLSTSTNTDLYVVANDFINRGVSGDVFQGGSSTRYYFRENFWTSGQASLDSHALAGAVVALTAQTANLAATNVYASAPVGEYRVCATARTTTSGTGTTATLNIIWTDEGGAKTDAVGTWALNSVTVTGQINKCEYIHAAAASNIQVSVTAGTYGTSVYAISATAEKLN